MRLSKEIKITDSSLNFLNESPYDFNKWNIGAGMIVKSGLNEIDNYVSPDFQVVRPLEESTAFSVIQVASYIHSSTYSYLFGVENSTATTATRRIHLWRINSHTGERAWCGFITINLSSSTPHTNRDFKIEVKNESVGTVSVSSTTVTGINTLFNTNGVAIGARIGFGSTNPAEITQWYRITAKASDTSLTINTNAGTIPSNTPYVIQEFRPIYIATNGTTTNGGIHYGKGITLEDFTPAGTTISLAISADNQKAIYWLKDASTQTNTVACGAGLDLETATPTSLNLYVLNSPSAGNYNIFKYNLHAALTVSAGASTSAFLLSTGTQAVTGTISQNANCVYANVNHGVAQNLPSIYFITNTRIYRSSLTDITSGNTTWISDNIPEIPTGGTSTYGATTALSTIEYLPNLDTFIVGTSHTGGVFSYVTQYVSSGQPLQKIFGRDYKLLDQSLKDSNAVSIFNNTSTVFSYTNAGGNRVYACKQGIATTNNQIYVMSFGCDWDYASLTNGRLISPEISTPNSLKFYKIFVNQIRHLGNNSLGKSTEAFKIYARTANIRNDSTTGWILIDETNSLEGFSGSESIQFAVEFKTIGDSCLPARILGLEFSYEDNTGDSHFLFSFDKSSITNKIFSWWFKDFFNTSVPNLFVRIYDAETGGLLLTDNTNSPTLGVFEKTINDGTTWTSYNNDDKTNNITFIRYIPNSLADNIKVLVVLSQA